MSQQNNEFSSFLINNEASISTILNTLAGDSEDPLIDNVFYDLLYDIIQSVDGNSDEHIDIIFKNPTDPNRKTLVLNNVPVDQQVTVEGNSTTMPKINTYFNMLADIYKGTDTSNTNRVEQEFSTLLRRPNPNNPS